MSKKILAMLMAVAMAFSLLPVTALAGNPSPLSITPPDAEKFATYEFYISKNAESPWYTQTVKTGDTLKPPADPTLAGSHFTGWKTADGKEVPFGTVTVKETSIIQCYAKWEENKNPIHVYFMAAEKAAENSNEVVYTGVAQNGAVTIPADYQDITWKTADGKDFDGKNITEDMNVYPASASCWLTFDSQGGSAIASHYVQQGESFELSKVSNPTKAGYRFAGWSLKVNGTKQTEVTPNGDTKLYALWTPTTADYTVIHWQENANDDGYSFKESQKLSGKTDGQTNATAKSYKGFTATEIKQQTISGDGSTIVNVYYQRNSYTIHFYYREYVSWKEYTDIRITAKHGADISSQWPEKKNSKTWSTNEKTGAFGTLKGPYQANIQTMPLGGAKYYGPKTGTTFESAQYYVEVLPGEDGTVKQGDVTYKLHHTDTTPGSKLKVTEEDKYPLTGFTYEEGTENGNRYNNARFYYTRNSYDVVYVNGAEVKKDSYRYEEDISGAGNYKLTNAPAGYEFGGWYSDPIGTKKYDFSDKKMPAQNITVYAKWVPITITLTIQGVDGVGSGNVNYKQVINEAGVYQQAMDQLAKANKTVLYWVTSTGERVDVNSQMTKDLTIRPVLKGDTYTVTYTGGAMNRDTHLYWYNTKSKVQEYTGEKSNKFLCWVDGNNQKYHPGDEILMTANVTLKPNFSGENPGQTKYSVTYHSNFESDATYEVNGIDNYAEFNIASYDATKLPKREGYDFTGWNTKRDGTGRKFEADSTALMNGANDNDLYAQWSQSTYTLTYDANGGQFGSGEATSETKLESSIPTGNHPLKYTGDYTPTHAKSEGKAVVFLGWSEKDDSEEIYDKGDTIPNLIQSVTINGNKTVYAVWGYDAIGKDNKPDGVPDVFNAVVTYNIVGGTWDGINNSATEVIKVKTFDETTKVWTNTDAKLSNIPEPGNVIPNNGYTKTGTWDTEPDKTTPVTANTTYTYKLSPVTTGTLTITKKVEGLPLNQLPQNFTITIKDESGTITRTLTKDTVKATGNDTLTWTIPSLTPGIYTVSEENAGVDGYTYKDTYTNSKNTDTGKSVTVEVNDTITMTVTNKYKKQEVVPTPDTSKPNVNKTATDLVNDKTNVTLSVGGKSAKENVAVMFLLDKSTSQGKTRPEAARMLQYLKSLTNTNIIYDVVIFSGNATSTGWRNISADNGYEDTVKNFANKEPSSGTNMPAGIDQALKDMNILKRDYSSYSENTYLVTISDGITYIWDEDGTTKTVPVAEKQAGVDPKVSKTVDTWDIMYGPGVSFEDVYTDFANFLTSIPQKMKQTKESGYVCDYTTSDPGKYIIVEDTDKFSKTGTPNQYACAPEFSAYYSTIKYQELVKRFTKSFALPMPELEEDGTEKTTNWDVFYPWGKELMLYLQSNSSNSGQGVVHDADAATIFAGIRNEILYEIKSGSITDVIGADFSLTNQTLTKDTFTLTVKGEKVAANEPSGNEITFGEIDKSTGKYPYVLTYYKGTATKNADNTYTITSGEKIYKYTPCDKTGEVNGSVSDEFFVLEMNVPVVRLDLTYNLSLTSKRTASGTYEVPTNESATLEYTSANKNSGTVDFNEPTVSYTVKSSSGSHSGGSRPSLNTKDHYGYIIGYPVDYYTGQPTTDQTKKPVRPEGKITRAEVATIYFRMLTDESRTKFWSQNSGYSDVKAGDWFNNAVSTLSKAGIIAGYEDGSFRPNGYITRAEFATIAARFFDVTYNGKDLFPDISGHWAKDYINQAANKGFVNGYEDGTFKPDRNITRAEAVTLVNRTLDRHPDKNHFTKDMLVWPDNMDQTKWYYADMQEATNSHTYQMKENSDKTKYENWTKTLPIRNWEALEKAWSNANSSQGNGNVV